MNLTISRSKSWLFSFNLLPLTIFLNGKVLGKLQAGETRTFNVPALKGSLQVGITHADAPWRLLKDRDDHSILYGSQIIDKLEDQPEKAFRTGLKWWLNVDIFSFGWLHTLNHQVFYLEADHHFSASASDA